MTGQPSPYWQGMADRRQCHGPQHNPHPRGTYRHGRWAMGWLTENKNLNAQPRPRLRVIIGGVKP